MEFKIIKHFFFIPDEELDKNDVIGLLISYIGCLFIMYWSIWSWDNYGVMGAKIFTFMGHIIGLN